MVYIHIWLINSTFCSKLQMTAVILMKFQIFSLKFIHNLFNCC